MTVLTREELYAIYNDISDCQTVAWQQMKMYEKDGNDLFVKISIDGMKKRDELKKKLQKMIDEAKGR